MHLQIPNNQIGLRSSRPETICAHPPLTQTTHHTKHFAYCRIIEAAPRLRGHGLQDVDFGGPGERGDQVALVEVETCLCPPWPASLSSRRSEWKRSPKGLLAVRHR